MVSVEKMGAKNVGESVRTVEGTNFELNRLRDRVAKTEAQGEQKRTSDEEKRKYEEIDLSKDTFILLRGL